MVYRPSPKWIRIAAPELNRAIGQVKTMMSDVLSVLYYSKLKWLILASLFRLRRHFAGEEYNDESDVLKRWLLIL